MFQPVDKKNKMKTLLLVLLFICSVDTFSQSQEHLTHWGNYNPPDDPAIGSGWLVTGFFLHLHHGGWGFILSVFGIGVFYDTQKMEKDFEGRIDENRRVFHKRQKKKHSVL